MVRSPSERHVSLLLDSSGRSFGDDSKIEWSNSEVEVEAVAILNALKEENLKISN